MRSIGGDCELRIEHEALVLTIDGTHRPVDLLIFGEVVTLTGKLSMVFEGVEAERIARKLKEGRNER